MLGSAVQHKYAQPLPDVNSRLLQRARPAGQAALGWANGCSTRSTGQRCLLCCDNTVIVLLPVSNWCCIIAGCPVLQHLDLQQLLLTCLL